MSRNYYAEINLHLTWHTQESAPLLVPNIEAIVHHYQRGRCINTPGVYIHEIGGIETHVHLCLSIVPTITISDFNATIGHALGLPLTQEFFSKSGRPFKVAHDGKPVTALFS